MTETKLVNAFAIPLAVSASDAMETATTTSQMAVAEAFSMDTKSWSASTVRSSWVPPATVIGASSPPTTQALMRLAYRPEDVKASLPAITESSSNQDHAQTKYNIHGGERKGHLEHLMCD